MRKVAFFILGMVLAIPHVSGQKLTGLVREIISEYQENATDPDSWVSENRQIFSYNAKGLQSYSTSLVWDIARKD